QVRPVGFEEIRASYEVRTRTGLLVYDSVSVAMMEQMGVPPPKDLYPSLMSMSDLSAQDLKEIEQQAKDRVQSGLVLMTEAIDQMSQASSENDFVSMQVSAVLFREGFARFESGLATRQLLSEGQQPQEIALDWFRREMNIHPQSPDHGDGPMGLSWFHFSTMIVLIVFGVAMIWMYILKMRRASMLIVRLTESQGKQSSDA
ncbi:MAG: hypothetical protein JKX70_05240, partial [Phycisphaerales bacterium]|nr:hypothetical protein [Phycisphaerales bacterium]